MQPILVKVYGYLSLTSASDECLAAGQAVRPLPGGPKFGDQSRPGSASGQGPDCAGQPPAPSGPARAFALKKPVAAAFCLARLRQATAAYGRAVEEAFSLNGGLLLIGFEGTFFPEEETLQAMEDCLRELGAGRLLAAADQTTEDPEQEIGRLDYLDLEKWVLRRHCFTRHRRRLTTRPLNHVLDYSGH